MYWEKKITIRITVRRVVGVVLAASTVANLIIVGVVFGADSSATPTITSVWTSSLSTATLWTTTGETSTSPWTYTPGGLLTDTPDITQTESLTPTNTPTPTETVVNSPGRKFCIKRFYWQTYRVQYGDTLSSLARTTSSSVSELMAANCLTSSRIYAGQTLYMPRLPYTATIMPSATDTPSATATPSQTATDTPTDTYTPITPSVTPTDTPSPTPIYTLTVPSPTSTITLTSSPINSPTVFENPDGYPSCAGSLNVYFSVRPIDPEGIKSVTVHYTQQKTSFAAAPMNPDGDTYFGGGETNTEPTTYYFRAVDGLGTITESDRYQFSVSCS